MNKLLACFFAGLLVLLASCAPAQPARTTLAKAASDNAVALVMKDGEGDTIPYCSGTWISKKEILTANHCIEGAIEAWTMFNNVDSSIRLRPMGFKVDYIVEHEATGMYDAPSATHAGVVTAADESKDLAIITVIGIPPMHTYAELASVAPVQGEEIHVVGHVVGLYWTYTTGYVSAIRPRKWMDERVMSLTLDSKTIQVMSPLWRGQSGSAAYDSNGEVIGVLSFLGTSPSAAFLIHLDEVKTFIANSRSAVLTKRP